MMDIHIGEIIRNYLETKKISSPAFAKMLGMHRDGVARIFYRKHFHSKLLLQISQALNHNFFQYYVPEMVQEEKKKNEELQGHLLKLQTENDQLKTKNDFLEEMMQMMKGKKIK